jgi:3',5'-cyclic AMP phosphodiesterase CpdA
MLGTSRLVGAALRRGSPLLGVSRLPSTALPTARVRFFVQQPPRARSPSFLTSLATRRTSSSLSKASENVATATDGMSHMERLKDLWRKYGVVAIGTYLTMYGTVLGSIYLAIDQGWVRTNKRSVSKGEGQSDESFNLVTTTNK